MSGWDFIIVGLELMNYNQARQARKNLGEIKNAQEMAAAQQAMLVAMRNFIFDIARDIQMAENNILAYPQQVYIVANVLGWRLHDSGLTPEIFPEFNDKDYVFKTQNKIVEVAKRCQQALTQPQTEQADLAVEYVIEMSMLLQATKAKWSFEQIQATQAKWDQITKESNAKTSSGLMNALGIFGAFIGATIICQIGSSIAGFLSNLSDNQTVQTVISLPITIVSFLLGLAAIGAGLYYFGPKLYKTLFGTKADPDAAPLRQKREEWKKNLMPPTDWEQVKSLFGGDLSSVQFRKIYKERLTFLEPIMGGDYVKTLLLE